jgi:hypothetical protein
MNQMQNDIGLQGVTKYETTGGQILPPIYEDVFQVSPSILEVLDIDAPVRWRWRRARETKIALGFAMAMNPRITPEKVEKEITDRLTRITEQLATGEGIPEYEGKHEITFGAWGLNFTARSGMCDGYPITMYLSFDLGTMLSGPPEYDCRAKLDYDADPSMDFNREFIAKYKDTELPGSEKPWFE